MKLQSFRYDDVIEYHKLFEVGEKIRLCNSLNRGKIYTVAKCICPRFKGDKPKVYVYGNSYPISTDFFILAD